MDRSETHSQGVRLGRYGYAVQKRGDSESETELVSPTAQGPAKNAIKIDVLLTDSDNRGSQKIFIDCW